MMLSEPQNPYTIRDISQGKYIRLSVKITYLHIIHKMIQSNLDFLLAAQKNDVRLSCIRWFYSCLEQDLNAYNIKISSMSFSNGKYRLQQIVLGSDSLVVFFLLLRQSFWDILSKCAAASSL